MTCSVQVDVNKSSLISVEMIQSDDVINSQITFRDIIFRPKVGQIGPKWDKSGIFLIRFQYILARLAPDLSYYEPI